MTSESDRQSLLFINEQVNTDLADQLRKCFLRDDGVKYKITEVHATLAFVLGDAIATVAMAEGIPEPDMCTLSIEYEKYLHHTAHACYEGMESGELPRAAQEKKSH